MGKRLKWMFSKKELVDYVNKSSSFKQLLISLGMSYKGSNYITLKKRLDFYKISYKHILDRSNLSRNKSISNFKLIPLKQILIENSTYRSNCNLKKRLFEKKLLKNECYECGLQPFWNQKELVLHLDHINGCPSDNRIENLRILCPNCHNQTDTFGRKGRIKPCKKCMICDKEMNRLSKYFKCIECSGIGQRKVKRPSKEKLERMLKKMPATHIAKKYRVTDMAIRKWAFQYKIDLRIAKYSHGNVSSIKS